MMESIYLEKYVYILFLGLNFIPYVYSYANERYINCNCVGKFDNLPLYKRQTLMGGTVVVPTNPGIYSEASFLDNNWIQLELKSTRSGNILVCTDAGNLRVSKGSATLPKTTECYDDVDILYQVSKEATVEWLPTSSESKLYMFHGSKSSNIWMDTYLASEYLPVQDTKKPTISPVVIETSSPTTSPVVNETNSPTVQVVPTTKMPTTSPTIITTWRPTSSPTTTPSTEDVTGPQATTDDSSFINDIEPKDMMFGIAVIALTIAYANFLWNTLSC